MAGLSESSAILLHPPLLFSRRFNRAGGELSATVTELTRTARQVAVLGEGHPDVQVDAPPSPSPPSFRAGLSDRLSLFLSIRRSVCVPSFSRHYNHLPCPLHSPRHRSTDTAVFTAHCVHSSRGTTSAAYSTSSGRWGGTTRTLSCVHILEGHERPAPMAHR